MILKRFWVIHRRNYGETKSLKEKTFHIIIFEKALTHGQEDQEKTEEATHRTRFTEVGLSC